MKKLALGCLSLALSFSSARADIIPSFAGVTDGNVGVVWTYTASLTAEQNANTGDFFTIYDFGNIVPASNVQPAGWTLTTSLLGVNPAQTNIPDNPNVLNLTWTYSGLTIVGTTLAGQNMGPFSVEAFTRESRFSYFAAQGTLAQGPEAGSKVGNVGSITVPVPEPSTIALIIGTGGLGLVGRALSRRRRL